VARIDPIPMEQAEGKARELLDELVQRGGEPGPMARAMANAPALLRGYLDLTRAMKRSHLDRRIIERISLAAQEWLGCEYCIAAHTRAARRLGLSDREIELARQGTSTDPKVAAIVAFGQQVIAAPAEVTDAQVDELRAFGYRDEQIAEVVGMVSLQLLTGGFNLDPEHEPPRGRAWCWSSRRTRPQPRTAPAPAPAPARRSSTSARRASVAAASVVGTGITLYGMW
jgi:AhpD family alkylhydroperoxidase